MNKVDLIQGTPNWFAWRRDGVTATEAAAIVGESKWGTAMTVYRDKKNPPDYSEKSAVQEWGSRIEELLRQKFAENHKDFHVVQGDCWEDDWRKASLDGEITDSQGNKYILECKTGRNASDWDNDSVPRGYYAQVQWQMLVTGMRRVYFAVLINGFEYFERVVEFNEAYANDMLAKCSKFWDDYQAGIMPERTLGKEDIEQPLLTELAATAENKDEALEIDDTLFERYTSAREDADNAAKRLASVKAELTELLARHTYLTHAGKKFASVVQMKARESIDTVLLKSKYADVYDDVKKLGKPTVYVRFG